MPLEYGIATVNNTPYTNQIDAAEALKFRSKYMYTTKQKSTVSLLKILDEANALKYAFDQVLEWAPLASNSRYSFRPVGGHSRSKNTLINSVQNDNKLLPFVPRTRRGIVMWSIWYPHIGSLTSLSPLRCWVSRS